MDATDCLLSHAYLSVPKFKGSWVEPHGLSQVAALLSARRILLLTALPGSGKSRLMTRLFSEMQAAMDVCFWLRVPPAGQSGELIARGFATGLVRSIIGERSATAAMLMSGAIKPSITLTVALNEVAQFSGRIILFIDDAHLATHPGDIADLQRLLEEAPDNLRIVLASRTILPLRLARLRMVGALREIGSEQFMLGFDQIPDYLTELGEPRPQLAEQREIFRQTGGWVAALRLVAQRAQRGALRASDDRGIRLTPEALSYFEQEVFSGLSDEARGALDMALAPHRLVDDLLVSLIGGPDAAGFLREFEAQGLLIPKVEGGRTEYRAAPLIAAAARCGTLLEPDDLTALHARCCDWFEENGFYDAAAAHAIDGGDFPRAVDLVDRCGKLMIAAGRVAQVQDWLPKLPLDELRKRPSALLTVAWGKSLLYRLDQARVLLAILEDELAHRPEERAAIAPEIRALEIMHLSMRDDFAASAEAARAWHRDYPDARDWSRDVVDNALSFSLAHLGRVEEARLVLDSVYLPAFFDRSPYAAIYGRSILGLIDLRQGNIRRAETHFSWALKAAEGDASARSTGTVMAAGLLAGARFERNDIAGMRQLVDSYAPSMDAHLFTDARREAYRAIAGEEMVRGQFRAAISTLERILDAGPSVSLPRSRIDALAEKVVVALRQHDLRMANTYVRALGGQLAAMASDDPLHSYVEATLFGSQAHLDIVVGAADKALPLLRDAIRLDLKAGWRLRAFRWGILMVRALWNSDQRTRAVRLMDRLLGMSVRAGIFRSIIDGGSDITQVLNMLAATTVSSTDRRKQRHLRMLREALDPSLASRDVRPPDDASRTKTLLTEREIALIRLVRGGMTNRQIAARMQVSENTIKWHLKNVFEKACVKKRADLATLALR